MHPTPRAAAGRRAPPTPPPAPHSGYPGTLRSAPRLIDAAADLVGQLMDGMPAAEMEQQLVDAGWGPETGEGVPAGCLLGAAGCC